MTIDEESFTLVTEPRVKIGRHERDAVYQALLYGRAMLLHGDADDPLRTAWMGYGSSTGALFVEGFTKPVLYETSIALAEALRAESDPALSENARAELADAIAIVDHAIGLLPAA